MKDVIVTNKKLINDSHLKHIFSNDSYLELGIIDVDVIKRILSYELVNINDITYFAVQNKGLGHSNLLDHHLRDYMPFHFFRRLAENNPKLQLYISYGLLEYYSKDHHERFMPIILIPIAIYFENDDILVQMTSSPIENPLLYTVINNPKIFFLQTHTFKDIYSLDFVLSSIDKIPNVSVRLDNYLTYGQYKEKDIILTYKNNQKNFNEQHKSFDRLYLNNYFNDYSSVVLNKTQREVLTKLINGESLNITGINGTGKTTVLKDFIVNNIYHKRKTIYVSNSKESVKEMKKFLDQLMLSNYVVDLNNSFKVVSKSPNSESYYDPVDNIEPLLEQLKGYYEALDEYEQNMTKSLYGFKFCEMISHNYLINKELSSKIDNKWVQLDNINSIYKHEYQEIKKVLDQLEQYFNRIESFRESVWNQIPIINTITHDNQVFNVVFQLNTGFKKLRDFEIALGTYGVRSISSFSEIKKYIEPMDVLKEDLIPDKWKSDLAVYREAKKEYNNLVSEIYKYQEAEYYLLSKYKQITDLDLDNEINNLFGSFYLKSNDKSFDDKSFDIIEKLLINKKEIQRIINLSLIDIYDFNKIYLELKDILNFDFIKKDEYLNEIIYIYNLYNHYNINGKTITIVLKNRLDSDINELNKLNNNIITLNDELKVLEKNSPKLKTLDFSKGNIEYVNKTYRTYDTKLKKVKRLIRDYYDLVGFSYLDHQKNIDSIYALKDYYQLIKNKKYRKVIIDFIKGQNEDKYLEIKVILGIFIKAYNNILDNIKYFEQYDVSFEKESEYQTILRFSEYLEYLNNLYQSNERLYNIILNNDFEYVKPLEYFNLKNEIDKLNSLIDNLKNNQLYYEIYGYLYQAQETNTLSVLKAINMFDEYVKVFVSEDDIYNSFVNYDKLNIVVKNVVQLINEIGENLRLYSMLFKDSVSRYYFSNIEANVEYLSNLLKAKEELTVYLDITHCIGVLNSYHLDSIIQFVENSDNIEGISQKFSEVYFDKITKEYLEKYDSLNNDSLNNNNLNNDNYLVTLNKTVVLEDIICKQKGISFVNEILKRMPVDSKKRKVKHFDYRTFFRMAHHHLSVYLCNVSFLRNYYKYIDYETVIIDDAHMLTTGEYNNIFRNKQVIICGDYQSNMIVNQNLLSLANSVATYTFKNRYYNAPRKLTSHLQASLCPHQSMLNHNVGVKVIERDLVDYLYNLYIQDNNVKINYFIKNINHQRKAYENICSSFYNKGLEAHEIIKFLDENIRICDINIRNYLTSDYNILYFKDYCNENSQVVTSNLFEILMLAKNEVIIYDFENSLLKNIESRFFKQITNLVVSEGIFNTNKEELVNQRIKNKLTELGYNVYNSGNNVDMLIQSKTSDKLYTLLILYNNGNVSEVLNIYRDFYDQYMKSEHKVIIFTMVDLLKGEEYFINKLVGELDG